MPSATAGQISGVGGIGEAFPWEAQFGGTAVGLVIAVRSTPHEHAVVRPTGVDVFLLAIIDQSRERVVFGEQGGAQQVQAQTAGDGVMRGAGLRKHLHATERQPILVGGHPSIRRSLDHRTSHAATHGFRRIRRQLYGDR